MIEDKERWNRKYTSFPMPGDPSPTLLTYLHHANHGKALDIACGTGRNTSYLAEQGFLVDAVDISENALSQIPLSKHITTIVNDLDDYAIAKECYSLIVNCNYLDRKMFTAIKEGLRDGGLLLFETFVETEGEGFHQPSNPDYLLQVGELKAAFLDFDIIQYDERESQNLRGEKVKIASLVAKKRNEPEKES